MTNPVAPPITAAETPTASTEAKALSAVVTAVVTTLTSASAIAENPQGGVDRALQAGKTAAKAGKAGIETAQESWKLWGELRDAWHEMNFFFPPAPAFISWAFLVMAIMAVIEKKEWRKRAVIPSIILTRLAIGGMEHWAPEYLWGAAGVSAALGGYLALYQKKEFWIGIEQAFKEGGVRGGMRYIKALIKPPAKAPRETPQPQEEDETRGRVETVLTPPACSGCGSTDLGPGACYHCGTPRGNAPAAGPVEDPAKAVTEAAAPAPAVATPAPQAPAPSTKSFDPGDLSD